MKYENFLYEPLPSMPVPNEKQFLITLRLVVIRSAILIICYALITSDAGKEGLQRLSHHHINSITEVKGQFCKVFGL